MRGSRVNSDIYRRWLNEQSRAIVTHEGALLTLFDVKEGHHHSQQARQRDTAEQHTIAVIRIERHCTFAQMRETLSNANHE